MGPFGTIWDYFRSFDTIWPHLAPFGPIWPPLAPFGPIWPHLAPVATIWPHLGLRLAFMKGFVAFMSIWEHLGALETTALLFHLFVVLCKLRIHLKVLI